MFDVLHVHACIRIAHHKLATASNVCSLHCLNSFLGRLKRVILDHCTIARVINTKTNNLSRNNDQDYTYMIIQLRRVQHMRILTSGTELQTQYICVCHPRVTGSVYSDNLKA